MVTVWSLTALVCYNIDKAAPEQTKIAAAIVCTAVVVFSGVYFGAGSFGSRSYPFQDEPIGVGGAIGSGVAAAITIAIVIAAPIVTISAIAIVFVGFDSVRAVSAFIAVIAVIAAIIATITPALLLSEDLFSLATYIILLPIGLINFGILYGLPKLI